jgi:hypothetical protein
VVLSVTGLAAAQVLLDAVEMSDLTQDPSATLRGLLARLVKVASRMGTSPAASACFRLCLMPGILGATRDHRRSPKFFLPRNNSHSLGCRF